MPEQYDVATKTHVVTDDEGVVRGLSPTEPFVSSAATAQLAAGEYLNQHADLLGLEPDQLAHLQLTSEAEPADLGSEFRLHAEKRQFDTTTVVYDQTHLGLPVWEAAVAVHLKNDPYRAIGASSSRHPDVSVTPPPATKLKRFTDLDAKTLATLLGLSATAKEYDRRSLELSDTKLVVYRYEAARRLPAPEPADSEDLISHASPTLPIPDLPASIEEGGHYVAAVVHFRLSTPQFPDLHWRAIIDVATGAVLHLRAFVDDVNGMVFDTDPMTTAPSGPLPSATTMALNAKRVSVLLEGLIAPVNNTQTLRGDLVTVSDVETPAIAPPTETTGTSFDFDSRTDNFAAVNAYYHCDRFFRLVASLGFSLPAYFGATPFPSVTDHRGLGNPGNPQGNLINAHCVGMSGGVGIQQTTFALADLGDTINPIGIACDWRVALHELGGHGILYPHVHSPNFGFSHSAGDSFAAILNDPTSAAADRFVTFPWVNIGRRHDRAAAAGWGWGGTQDVGGYSSEQILSTTHFRIYRSVGGDAALPIGLGSRQFAARLVSYLILRAVGSLTQPTNPPTVDQGYIQALLAADLGDWTSEGLAGGAYGKVIRWAFEKQGAYQPPNAPTPVIAPGAPPAVDVYIDDGRHGEYDYQPAYWNCQAIWNRRHPDGMTTHENPIVGTTNHAYVKVKNRGTQTATSVVVKAFHANPAAGLVYPNDWQAMTTPQLAGANVAPNNSAEIVVGPFEWTPTHVGHECMFMIASAAGDPSNVSNLSAGESINEWRLVPHDNNIAQRNVSPVPFTTLKPWLIAIERLVFTLKNPLSTAARMMLRPRIPALLTELGWQLEFSNPGGGALKMRPGETKEISMRLAGGRTFTAAQLAKDRDPAIHVEAYANGMLIGGMTFPIAPQKAVREVKPARAAARKR